jgi:hypothetical protein
MNKLTETKHVLYALLPSVLINIINSYYESYELIKRCSILRSDNTIIIDNNICIYYKSKKCAGLAKDYKTVFDYDYPNDFIQTIRTYNEVCHIISFRHHISLSNVYNVSDIMISFSDIPDKQQKICIVHQNIKKYLPEFTSTQYIVNFRLYNNELYLSVCDMLYKLNVDIYKINLCTYKYQYITQLPYGKLFVSKSFIYTLNDTICAYDIKYGTKTTITHNMYLIHYITDNYIFGQLTLNNVLSVVMINSPHTISTISTYWKIGFGENKFFTLHKFYNDPNNVSLRAYIIDD